MENKFTPELIEKAKSAKTPEELMALAKENGVELTEESAKAYFEQLNPNFSTGVLRCSGCFASDPRCRNCMNSIGDKSDTVLKCKVHPRPC